MKIPGIGPRDEHAPGPDEQDEESHPVGVSQRARGSLMRHVPIPTAEELRRRATLDAPTVRDNLLPVITGPQVADDALVLRVLDLALRIGEIQLATGAGAAAAHDTMLAIATAYGLPTCDVDIAFSTITMCCHRGVEAGPVTTMRNVRYRTQDYTRLAGVDALIKDIVDVDAPVSSSVALTRLATAVDAPHPYPRWVAGFSRSLFASAVAVLIGGGAGVALAAFLLTGVVWSLARWLGRHGVPMFFQQVLGATLVTTTALLLGAAGFLLDSPSLVVATGLIVLLSGLALVGLVQDAITGFPLTAAGRAVEVVLASAGLLVGVVVSIKVLGSIGGAPVVALAQSLPDLTPQADVRSLVAAAAAGVLFALSAYAPLPSLPVAGLAAAVTWGLYAYGVGQVGLGQVIASAAAAGALGLIAMLMPVRVHMPPLVLVIAGITPLLPGLLLYQGFARIALTGDTGNVQTGGGSLTTGAVTILLALTVSLGIAAGVSFGEQIGWPISRLWRRPAPSVPHPRRPRIF